MPSSAGSKRFVEFTVLGEPFVAVPATKSTPVWKMPMGESSFRQMKPLVCGSQERPSVPVLSTKVPIFTV